MLDPTTVSVYVGTALVAVLVLAAVFGRRRTRRAAYRVLALLLGRPRTRFGRAARCSCRSTSTPRR